MRILLTARGGANPLRYIGCVLLLLPVVLLVSFIASIGSDAEEGNFVPGPPIFGSLPVDGDGNSAKAADFRNCATVYQAIECVNPSLSLLGINAPAHISMPLNGQNVPKDLSGLKYNGIMVSLPRIKLRENCEDGRYATINCDMPSKTLDFQRALVDRGWKMHRWRGARTYYHAGQTTVVEIENSNIDEDSAVATLRTENPHTVIARLKEIEKFEKLEASSKRNF